MEYLITNAVLLDIRSAYNRRKIHLLIQDDRIKQIFHQDPPPVENFQNSYDAQGAFISPGWFEMRADFCDPGFEHRESLENGLMVAEKGGYTGVALLPNTQPVIQHKNDLAYLRQFNRDSLVQVYPIAALSEDTRGEAFNELIDLHQHGAVAFSDGHLPIWHSDVLMKSLMYLQKFDGLLIQRPEDRLLTQSGSMNDGKISTLLGLKGMPAIAETLIIQRDLSFLAYTGGRLHFSLVSAAASLQLIREAKAQGLSVTCDTAAYHLLFDDRELLDFDSNFKVNPPLRKEEDQKALLESLSDNTIDVLVSNHLPQDTESKNVAFDQAAFGMNVLEHNFALLNQALLTQPGLKLEQMIEKITHRPREILNIPLALIEEGAQPNFTIFDPERKWTLASNQVQSKSMNNPFIGKELVGKPCALFNNGIFQEIL